MLLTVGIAALSGLHATQDPEVVWRHHSNPEPWNAYANKQYKVCPLLEHQFHLNLMQILEHLYQFCVVFCYSSGQQEGIILRDVRLPSTEQQQ